MTTGYESILDALYEEHYSAGRKSDVTSSHWLEIGGHEVKKTDGSLTYVVLVSAIENLMISFIKF